MEIKSEKEKSPSIVPSSQQVTPPSLENYQLLNREKKSTFSERNSDNFSSPLGKKQKKEVQDFDVKLEADIEHKESETSNNRQIIEFLAERGFDIAEVSTPEVIEDDLNIISLEDSVREQIGLLKKLGICKKIPQFDWQKIEEVYSVLFNRYISQMDGLIKKLDSCHRERIAWSEISYALDRERSSERLVRSENWVSTKQKCCNQLKTDFERSINIMENEFQKLQNPDVESGYTEI